MKTIEQTWLEFESQVLNRAGVGPIQRQEMRRAYYAGVVAMRKLLDDLGADEISDDVMHASIDLLKAELAVFGDDLRQGRA